MTSSRLLRFDEALRYLTRRVGVASYAVSALARCVSEGENPWLRAGCRGCGSVKNSKDAQAFTSGAFDRSVPSLSSFRREEYFMRRWIWFAVLSFVMVSVPVRADDRSKPANSQDETARKTRAILSQTYISPAPIEATLAKFLESLQKQVAEKKI